MEKYYISISDMPTEKAIEQKRLYLCAECLSYEEAKQNKDALVSEWLDKVNKQKQYIKPLIEIYTAILIAEGQLELTK